jgi:hypothetical protein
MLATSNSTIICTKSILTRLKTLAPRLETLRMWPKLAKFQIKAALSGLNWMMSRVNVKSKKQMISMIQVSSI